MILCLLFSLCACSATETANQETDAPAACDASSECTDDNETETAEFTEISMEDALDYFRQGKSGVLFFGFTSCPWCKQARPILKKVSAETGVPVYYIKVRDEDGNLTYSDEQREELSQYIGDYMSVNKDQDNKLWLYVPLVINVKDGKAVDGHEGTLKGHNAEKEKLTAKQKKKLKKIYKRVLTE